ncbi:MAG: malate dehydrogenase [Syntrophorhabdus aromaticivorans]|uniref:Malate dehydrogenase n=1 Tax=Syntrophorhabdus aromaticivorans TaxID=328301 RepID=A0A971M3F0_9BACT|nr:malate dehydrogenase [Syntrophorhabdus aromaticivorans]
MRTTGPRKEKITIVGAGNVGSSLAHIIDQSSIANVVIYDVVEGLPQGRALDLAEACPLWNSTASVIGTNDYADTEDSDVIVVTAGLPRKPGMSRDDLLQANAGIVSQVVENISKFSPDAIMIVVTNPMDAMTQLSMYKSGFNPKRVMGMGGILDSARFRTFVAWEFGVSTEDVEALVLGGHGDLMVPMPRYTTVKGIPITELITGERIESLVERTRKGGEEIVKLLKTGSAHYAPAAAIYQMIKALIFDEKRVLSCSAYLYGEYGVKGVYTGVPVVLGSRGIEKIIELPLNEEEKANFEKSVEATRSMIEAMNL